MGKDSEGEDEESGIEVEQGGMNLGNSTTTTLSRFQVMDNLLVQVVGRKRVVLFPPSDAPYLYLTGDKSRVMDIDTPDPVAFPEFSRASRWEAELAAGEALYIPALWFHNVDCSGVWSGRECLLETHGRSIL